MVQRQPQTQLSAFSPDGFRQLRDMAAGLATFPALTVMLFMRQRVGYDKLTLGSLFCMSLLLGMLNEIGNFHVALPLGMGFGSAYQSESLRNFALLFLAFGLWQRRKRWQDLRNGIMWHTYSHGVSWFEFLPIRQDLIYRIVDPVVAFLAGLILRKLGFYGLGLWVMFSALCFRLVEERVFELGLRRDLDVHNSLVESRVQAETLAYFEGQGEAKARSLSETGGIATGVDANLEAQIARRKKEAATGGAGMEVRS